MNTISKSARAQTPDGALAVIGAVTPKKRFGQNFLNDDGVLSRIGKAINEVRTLHPDITQLVEIGPGTGQLTKVLANQQLPTTAFEIDPEAFEYLQNQDLGKYIDLQLADALELSIDRTSLFGRDFLLVSNLPFNVGSRILVNLGLNNPINNPFLVILQKEVAQKALITKLEDHFTLFGAWINLFWNTKILFDIPRSSYTPAPDVATSVLRGLPRQDIAEFYRDHTNRQKALHMLKILTAHPRKTIRANLKYAGWDQVATDAVFTAQNWDDTLRLNADNYTLIIQSLVEHM